MVLGIRPGISAYRLGSGVRSGGFKRLALEEGVRQISPLYGQRKVSCWNTAHECFLIFHLGSLAPQLLHLTLTMNQDCP